MTKYKYDFSILEDNEKFYYLLGAILTDGSVSINKKRTSSVKLSLSSKDLDWLIIIRNLINGGHINCYRNCYTLNITNSKFIKKFFNHGLYENKSLNLKCPVIPKENYKDFLRGCIDGDGSISVFLSKEKWRCNTSLCSASFDFINGIREILIDCGFNVKINSQLPKNHLVNGRIVASKNPLYRLSFSMKKACNFISMLNYNNDLSMPRKKEIALSIINHYNNKSVTKISNYDFIINSINILNTKEIAKKLNICNKYVGLIIRSHGYTWNNCKKVWINENSEL